jgi:hypothetical protein
MSGFGGLAECRLRRSPFTTRFSHLFSTSFRDPFAFRLDVCIKALFLCRHNLPPLRVLFLCVPIATQKTRSLFSKFLGRFFRFWNRFAPCMRGECSPGRFSLLVDQRAPIVPEHSAKKRPFTPHFVESIRRTFYAGAKMGAFATLEVRAAGCGQSSLGILCSRVPFHFL